MKRIAAEYVFTLEPGGPLADGFVEYDDDGTVLRTGICDNVREEETFPDKCIEGHFRQGAQDGMCRKVAGHDVEAGSLCHGRHQQRGREFPGEVLFTHVYKDIPGGVRL